MQVNVVSETKQEFNGITYYKCGPYFQCKGERLHLAVWRYYHGAIPKGMAIHHRDHDRSNNDIGNLSIMARSSHQSYHAKLRDNSSWVAAMHEGARAWHGSEAGRQWHKEHYEKVGKYALHIKEQKPCKCCGEIFEGKPNGLFCSNKCKAKHRRLSGVDNVYRFCAQCGKKFLIDKYQKTVTCSRECGGKVSSSSRYRILDSQSQAITMKVSG